MASSSNPKEDSPLNGGKREEKSINIAQKGLGFFIRGVDATAPVVFVGKYFLTSKALRLGGGFGATALNDGVNAIINDCQTMGPQTMVMNLRGVGGGSFWKGFGLRATKHVMPAAAAFGVGYFFQGKIFNLFIPHYIAAILCEAGLGLVIKAAFSATWNATVENTPDIKYQESEDMKVMNVYLADHIRSKKEAAARINDGTPVKVVIDVELASKLGKYNTTIGYIFRYLGSVISTESLVFIPMILTKTTIPGWGAVFYPLVDKISAGARYLSGVPQPLTGLVNQDDNSDDDDLDVKAVDEAVAQDNMTDAKSVISSLSSVREIRVGTKACAVSKEIGKTSLLLLLTVLVLCGLEWLLGISPDRASQDSWVDRSKEGLAALLLMRIFELLWDDQTLLAGYWSNTFFAPRRESTVAVDPNLLQQYRPVSTTTAAASVAVAGDTEDRESSRVRFKSVYGSTAGGDS